MLPFTSRKSGQFLRATHNRRLKKSRSTSRPKAIWLFAVPHRSFARHLSVPHDGQIADAGRDSAFCELERSVSAVLILESALNDAGVVNRMDGVGIRWLNWLLTRKRLAEASCPARLMPIRRRGAKYSCDRADCVERGRRPSSCLANVFQPPRHICGDSVCILSRCLCPSAWFTHARGSCLAISPGRDHPDDSHRVGYCLGSRKNPGPSTGVDTRHGYAA